MKTRQNQTGVTLVEILVAVAIIAILLTIVISVAARIDTQGKEQLTEETIALLTAALSQFSDYGYAYNAPFDVNFSFPLDCNNFSKTALETELQIAMGATASIGGPGAHSADYSGSEAMYFFLGSVPESRETLDRIGKSLITSEGSNGGNMTVTVGGKPYPLFRVIDPWGRTLRYDCYDEKPPPYTLPVDIDNMVKSMKTFPVITSAGPDKNFGTADDITSR